MAVVNTFEKGPEGWCSYDYHASIIAGQNYFVLTTWEERGGADDTGCVWQTTRVGVLTHQRDPSPFCTATGWESPPLTCAGRRFRSNSGEMTSSYTVPSVTSGPMPAERAGTAGGAP